MFKKIAIIQPRIPYYIGGGEIVPMNQIKELSKRKELKIDLYTWKIPKNKQTKYYLNFKKEAINVNFIEIEIPKKYKYIFNEIPGKNQQRWNNESILFSNLIIEFLIKKNYDYLLYYYIIDALYSPSKTKKILYILGVPKKEIDIYYSLFNFIDISISNSKHVFNNWKKYFLKNKKQKNIILPTTGVKIYNKDKNIFKKNNNFNLVFAGRLIKRKGVDILIDTIELIKNKIPNIYLHILGDGPELKKLTKKVFEKKLNSNIKFYGYIDNNIQSYFYSADLVIFPSRNGEGLVTVAQEAMAAKSCIIASEKMGTEEIVENNKNGFLIKAWDKKILSKKILELFNNKKEIFKTKKEAFKYAKNNLIIEKWADNFLKILDN